ncbi:MAG: hypothetical protein WBB19_01795 [Desulforhopalus sp.]
MIRHRSVLLKRVITLSCLVIWSSPVWADEEPGQWDTAGKKISEAAGVIGKASGEGWTKTKEKTTETMHLAKDKGAEVWDKTKIKSSELVEKTVEVTGDMAEGTADKSKSLWQKTKDNSRKWLVKMKAKIHEMTAP